MYPFVSCCHRVISLSYSVSNHVVYVAPKVLLSDMPHDIDKFKNVLRDVPPN